MDGVKLPVRRDELPVSDQEYKTRFEDFLEAKGRNDPKLGFFGNWARYNHLEEEFRQLLKEEWAGELCPPSSGRRTGEGW